MHILVPEPPGEVGGADMHVHDLARYQTSAGLAATVVERGSREFADLLRAGGVAVESATGLGFRAAVRQLATLIEVGNPDVVHAHGYDADYWAAATRWRYPRLFRDKSLVFTQHGVVEDTLWHRGKTLLDAICMRAADGVVVCAADLAGRMQRWCPRGSVHYIPNGVGVLDAPPREDARRRLGLPPDGPVVGYVGRLSPEKRPDRVLELVSDVRTAGVPVTCVIVGSGPLRSDLERQAEHLGVRDAVLFTGLVRDVGTVYAALDALALLSDTETTSRVVIEAMTAGAPVVASAVGGVPELLDQGRVGYLVAPGNRTAAADALLHLLREPSRLVDEARSRAEELYVVEVMGRRITEFYSTLRAGPPAARTTGTRATGG